MNAPFDTMALRDGSDEELRFLPGPVLERIAHLLPTQAPLKDFIHQNTLHAFQNRSFHSAVDAAARLYGARRYMDVDWYRAEYRAGRIDDVAIDRALAALVGAPEDRAWWRRRLFESDGRAESDGHGAELFARGLRRRWHDERGVNLDALVHPMLFKLVGNFLDQGIAIWRMPHASDRFWNAVRRLVDEAALPLLPLSSGRVRELLRGDPETALLHALERIVGRGPGSAAHYERYLLELLLAHPGWSGMVRVIETAPQSLIAGRTISLLEVAALELLFELGTLERRLGRDFAPLVSADTAPPPAVEAPAHPPLTVAMLWHEALEWTYYGGVLTMLSRHQPETAPAAQVQAFFCIDDRPGSLRRHLEQLDPRISTFAWAGFYGIDMMFQRAGELYPVQHCPVVVKPRFLLRELPEPMPRAKRPRFLVRYPVSPASNTMFRGWLTTQLLGLWSSIRLALDVFRPTPGPATETALSRVELPTRLHLLRDGDEQTPDGLFVGYSIPEMADRVQGVLRGSGLTRDFAPLVVIIAHGSSSVNNPHFAAYDCGACSGKPGAPNARAFAWMANHPPVRAELRSRGFGIPEGTCFVGAVLDTSRDEVTYFDRDAIPAERLALFETFRATTERALRLNALERCRRFELAPEGLTPESALQHVRRRASSIFEPRPELNHATNALCIVGRRSRTRGLFFDRRAFLNSYDPTADANGDILASILNAAVPVCGGINLEYFFSRVDPEIYGAGTKLPHNVVGLVGVQNGVAGDLRTGLPTQMTEMHDPVRLLMIVEQEPEIALAAVRRNPAVWEWIENGWVRYGCLSPTDGRVHLYLKGALVPFPAEGSER